MLRHLRQRLLLPLVIAVGAVVAVPAIAQAQQIGFKTTTLQGASSQQATSLQWGPDGRLYVAQYDGTIKIYTVSRVDPANPTNAGTYAVTATQTIDSIKALTNHNDDGTTPSGTFNLQGVGPVPIQGRRLVTGLVVGGTAQNPVLYVSSSDPRWGGNDNGTVNDLNLDTNSGVISRLTYNGTSWSAPLNIVQGLPRSEENHAPNGMVLDGNMLYIAVGGNTNRGAPSTNFALLPEYELGAAILSVNLATIGNTTYNIPTRTRTPGVVPWGGNNGATQGMIVPGGPVQVYAPGFRSAYDLVQTQDGNMYTVDNGGNAGWGDAPINCANTLRDGGPDDPDYLHRVTPGYYGGHPNPTRVAVTGDTRECNFETGTAGHFIANMESSSTNGLAEYTASNFGGAMQGDLIGIAWGYKRVFRIERGNGGTTATVSTLVQDTRQITVPSSLPLDVATQGDDVGSPDTQFPGTIFIADQGNTNIIILEPNDYSGAAPVCTGADNAALDEDGDDFDNHDEFVNGTNPCSSADQPTDADGDKTSDRLDTNDDNDTMLDVVDPFQIDAQNGTGRNLPVHLGFDSGGNDIGLLNLGFTGMMYNGSTDYLDLFDINKLTARGAAGVFTLSEAGAGDAVGPANTQSQAFQFGVNVNGASAPFVASTRLPVPFGVTQPVAGQSMGIFIGRGDQSNFVKIVVDAGGVSVVKEVDGVTTQGPKAQLNALGLGAIELFLQVDPATNTVRPAYRASRPGSAGELTTFGADVGFPAAWLTSPTKLAVGIITNRGAAVAFPATWDSVDVAAGSPVPVYVAPPVQETPGGGTPPAPPVTVPGPAPTPVPGATQQKGTQKPAAKGPDADTAAVWDVALTTRSFTAARTGSGYSRTLKGPGTVLSLEAANTGRATVTFSRVSGKKVSRVAGTVTFSVKAGKTKVRITGRVAGKTLKAGSYKLKLSVKDAETRKTTSRTLTLKVR